MAPGFEAAVDAAAHDEGVALPPAIRDRFAPLSGDALGGVRIHTGAASERAAAALGANAYTHGQHIHFAAGLYRPGTPAGDRLLAHELVHTVQQGPRARAEAARLAVSDSSDPAEREADAIAGELVARGGEPAAAPPPDNGVGLARVAHRAPASRLQRDAPQGSSVQADPAPAELSFSLSGMTVTPREGAKFTAGPKLPQGMAIVLRRLLGAQYRAGLEDEALAHIRAKLEEKGGGLIAEGQLTGSAEGAEQIRPMLMRPAVALALLGWIDARGFTAVDVTAERRRLLSMGAGATDAWRDLRDPELAPRIAASPLPPWYTLELFHRELARRAQLLEEYIEARAKHEAERSAPNLAARLVALQKIVQALNPAAGALEAIRADAKLVAHPMYHLLWYPERFEQGKGGNAPPTPNAPAPPGKVPSPLFAASFLAFAFTQPILTLGAVIDHATRKELLDRFMRFAGRTIAAGGADERLFGTPPKANAPPLSAYLTVFPALAPPLFQAALRTDYAFVMHVEFPDVFEAFASYAYMWERIRIPESQLRTLADATQVSGERPSMKEVAKERFARVGRYNEADIKRVMGGITKALGPPGTGAPSLVMANAILRYVGAAINLGFEVIGTPSYERHVVFPEEGIYIVRARAALLASELAGGSEVVRPPSVAYIPVVVQPAERIAEAQTKAADEERTRAMARMAELAHLLAEPVTHVNQQQLEDELTVLEGELRSLRSSFEQQRGALVKRRDSLAVGSPERREVDRQIEAVDRLLETQRKRAEKRNMIGAERLVATFVNDDGQLIHLTLESVTTPLSGGGFEVYISDLTTTRSGHATGTGPTRVDAVKATLKKLLESESEYGRGHVSVALDGATYTQRVEAGTARLMMEAIESVSTVVSVAAVAAAPFTAGASLAILLPVGALGAIPSAYRLASRAEAATFRWFDLETAMDIVNVVGGFAGLGQAATPLRMVRLGKAFMFLGVGSGRLGVVLIGAQVVAQLDELKDYPPGLRAARTMQILGNALLTIGIAAGTELAARGHAREAAEGGAPPPRGPVDSASGVGAVHGPVYEQTGKGKLSPERLSEATAKVTSQRFAHDSRFRPVPGSRFTLEVPQQGGAPPIAVDVTVRPVSELPPGPHGDESGPARLIVTREGGVWQAEILVHRDVHQTSEAPHILAHELNELADLVHNHPQASTLVIEQQQKASLLKKGSSATDVTAHDRAAARELRSLYAEIPGEEAGVRTQQKSIDTQKQTLKALQAIESPSKEQSAKIARLQVEIPTQEASHAKKQANLDRLQARVERLLESAGLRENVNLERKLDVLREARVPEALIDEIQRPFQSEQAKAALMQYEAQGRPHHGLIELVAEKIQHLMFPRDVNTTKADWVDAGISGGHGEAQMKEWLKHRPELELVRTKSKPLPDGSNAFLYDQWRWMGPNSAPPAPGDPTRPGGSSFNADAPGNWVKSRQPKTTVEDLPSMLRLAEDAFQAWVTANPDAAQAGNAFGRGSSGEGTKVESGGVEFGGFYEAVRPTPPDTAYRYRIKTVFLEARWF
ncbi:hypothetical protein BE20_58830 [Sorangium cellulosum]|nr:hypothetical protein BE20_58830 [Sorangium cellulosum]